VKGINLLRNPPDTTPDDESYHPNVAGNSQMATDLAIFINSHVT
jgi:hypothetical protein